MSTQFDLEQQIMDCWHVVDDLKVVTESVLEDDLSRDKIANILLGMEQLYQLKFERLFRIFELLLKEQFKTRKPAMTQSQINEVLDKLDEMTAGIDETNNHGDVWDGNDAWVGTKEYEDWTESYIKFQSQGIKVKEEPMPDRGHILGNWDQGSDPNQIDWIDDLDDSAK